MAITLNSLTNWLLISISLRLYFLWFYLILFRTYFSVSSFVDFLCFLWTGGATTSPSLNRVMLYRSVSCVDWISGCLAGICGAGVSKGWEISVCRRLGPRRWDSWSKRRCRYCGCLDMTAGLQNVQAGPSRQDGWRWSRHRPWRFWSTLHLGRIVMPSTGQGVQEHTALGSPWWNSCR